MERCAKEGELMVLNKEVINLARRLDAYEQTATKNYDEIMTEMSSLRKIYAAIHELSTNVAVVAVEAKTTKESVMDLRKDIKELKHLPKETENIKETVRGIQGDVDKFKQEPADNLRHYKQALVVAVIGAIVLAFFTGKFT